MSLEIEAKMKVPDLVLIRQQLAEIGAQRAGKRFEVNIFFDTEDRSLLAADQGLRLRINEDEATRARTFVLTYKGPRLHGVLKTRQEVEIDVSNPDDGEKLLTALGYQRTLAFEKRRETWKLDGCSVELDELPHLGVFVEIEGPDEKTVMGVREKLRLHGAPLIRSSYIAMILAVLQERGLTQRTVKFG